MTRKRKTQQLKIYILLLIKETEYGSFFDSPRQKRKRAKNNNKYTIAFELTKQTTIKTKEKEKNILRAT